MSRSKEQGYQIAESKRPDGITLVLSGDLSLNNAKRLHKELLGYTSTSNNLTVVVKDAESIDLGAIQLLQSFAWTCLKRNNPVSVDFELNPDQQKLLTNAGIKLKF
ncbi:MAG: STAS domain-containing protein [Bacteroidales bacterium]|nr:STAS domain-containing protein [Bacteroidales bacterium]